MENNPKTVNSNESGCDSTANDGIKELDSTPHARGNAANQAGSSFSPLPDATTFEQQITKLTERGLIIDDEDFALTCLSNLNYYRLRGYWLNLEQDDKFNDGTSFSDIWETYQLDRELRKWLWQAIAPIEIKLRTQFAYQLAHRCGPDSYLDESNFRSKEKHERALKNYARERDRAYSQNVPYVVHNMDKYGELPVWAAVEIMSLGTLSMLYGNLERHAGESDSSDGIDVGTAVAKAFRTKPMYLKSWAHHLTTIRNIAAHHDRFYNRIINIKPTLLRRDSAYVSDKQFPTFLIIKRLYEKSWPEDWKELARELNACFDRHPDVDLAPMEFPENWKSVLGIAD